MDDRTSEVCDDAQLKDGQVMHKRGLPKPEDNNCSAAWYLLASVYRLMTVWVISMFYCLLLLNALHLSWSFTKGGLFVLVLS